MQVRVRRRFAWIEASLRYTGAFEAREKKAYRERFGLTDGMVSRDQDAFLRLFNEACGGPVVGKRRGRLYVTDRALPDVWAFTPAPSMTAWLEDALGNGFETVPPIRRAEPSPVVLKTVVQAIGSARRLRIRYHSRGGGESVRTVSPHAVIQAVGRLHLRAWDEARGAPRDFVLSRVISASVEAGQGYVNREHDRAWYEYVTVEVMRREGEDPVAVRLDYGLGEDGRATRRVREAHVGYLLDAGEERREFRSPVNVRRLTSLH